MTAIRFTEADALRCRFVTSPLWETVSAVRALYADRQRPIYEPWIGRCGGTAARLDLEALRAVQPQRGYTPDFLTPVPSGAADFATELARVRSAPVDVVAAELVRSRDTSGNPRAADIERMLTNPAAARERLATAIEVAWHELIEPDWPVIRRVLDDDIAYRGGQLTAGGLAALFDDIHPTLTWDNGRLIASSYPEPDVDLDGGGLLLLPGVFAWPHLIVMTGEQPMLVYPARGAARLWTDAPQAPDRLARLLGRTRATILAALDPPVTTSVLAQRYSLALSTVAEHLAALHDTGLAGRRRAGHQVHYRRTDLGQALLDAAVG